ncbi:MULTISPECIES: 23S rRNA (guanosine(2251)-2'-O)-methyltransferase RlmB [Croceitalea]|uniref:23S rRNA (Guanosine(2251)-2'-O)-methyltransferase RlmB n=1 Tax=Croceitalea vernalis TaxID=3075599 RepID=A0ABU3BJS7_9FLAO|nr:MULTISPECIES: 23S rRNA (guanosine(2251)-2'-O)-methyltransferase RlmB [unclassified Croceitalea]MDT0540552.1 23S rRNA (guanosine(2251)-2'-O)-methyltransferase RlmB [Croceitalea sp. P059]MDT0622408.1 23S rRNA (guanosine(2251)-2'-O)-methyltransferase RlmB [Croceitalea sp. P007]
MKKNQLIYGIRAIIEAIDAQKPINKLFLQKGLKGDLYKELEVKIRKSGLSVSYVPIEKLNRLSNNNHQGAIAQISPVAFHNFETLIEKILQEKKKPLLLLLDQVTDVRNFGAIIRTAECTGVDAIIIPKSGSAPITEDTVKTSAGAAFNIPISKVDHLKDVIFYLQASDITVVGATEKTEKSIYEIDFNTPLAILMGSEEKGISPSILKILNASAKLPLLGEIGSLNVSVACGVFLYEALRQRIN